MDRLGLGWSQLNDANPRLVYCSITGFGATGPYAQRPVYDSIASALSGFYSMIFDPDRPIPVGPPMSDLNAGLFSAQSVLAALIARGRTGRGQLVEVSMLGAMLAFLTEPASTWLSLGDVYGPDSRPRRAQVYAFISADGLPFLVHLSTPDKFWRALVAVVERPELLEDERFSDRHRRFDNYYALDEILKTAMRGRTRAEWFNRLQAADIPFAPIYRMDEVFEDPQVREMELTVSTEIPGAGEVTVLGHVVSFSNTPSPPVAGAPLLGQDTDAILASIGCSEQEIQNLLSSVIVA
jgi:formyl-CoA transferase